jgi:hypothetical protein
MARQQVVRYTYMCDVCGAEIPEGDAPAASRKFSWGGAEYQVDVCSVHQMLLTDTLDKLKDYVDAGRRKAGGRRRAGLSAGVGTARGRGSRSAGRASGGHRRNDLGAVRAWALSNGYQLGDRGRIAASIVEAYDAAHGSDGGRGSDGAPTAQKGRGRHSSEPAPEQPEDQPGESWRALATEQPEPSA